MISTDQISTLVDKGGVVLDESGSKIGKVGQVYLDDATGEPQWVTASTGFFGTSESFIPLEGATVEGDDVRVPFSKDKVKDAPRVESDGHISPEQEEELYAYYSMSYASGQDSETHGTDTFGTGTTGRENTGTNVRDESYVGTGTDDRDRDVVGRDTSGPTTDEAMTRSEEQVRVGTEKVATGKARLRKYVVTENVTKTVPVQREEVRVEREPITEANRGDAMAGGDITEEEHEVTLHEERVVVDKETVPVERVRLDKETVTEQEQVSEDVRKEQIETDLDGDGHNDRTDRR